MKRRELRIQICKKHLRIQNGQLVYLIVIVGIFSPEIPLLNPPPFPAT